MYVETFTFMYNNLLPLMKEKRWKKHNQAEYVCGTSDVEKDKLQIATERSQNKCNDIKLNDELINNIFFSNIGSASIGLQPLMVGQLNMCGLIQQQLSFTCTYGIFINLIYTMKDKR